MADKPWQASPQSVAQAQAARLKKVQHLIVASRQARKPAVAEHTAPATTVPEQVPAPPVLAGNVDFSVANVALNRDLQDYVHLVDAAANGPDPIILALFWPHTPPCAVLPWALLELGRVAGVRPLRALLVNTGRAGLSSLGEVEALTARLRELGVQRSGQAPGAAPVPSISPDSHFYMFLGNSKNGSVRSVPGISIIPHTVAINDGVYWRDFDEKTLKGFKRLYPENRLDAIRAHLKTLSSYRDAPAFAFLLPAHFDPSNRRAALRKLVSRLDLVVVDMTLEAIAGREAGPFIQELIADLEATIDASRTRLLIICNCPVRWSHLYHAIRSRRDAGAFGKQIQKRHLLWRQRGRGFDPLQEISRRPTPNVELIASNEAAAASRLWQRARELDDAYAELARALTAGAFALKRMATSGVGANVLLSPYSDARDLYHRIKRETHSFEPHYNEAMAKIAEGQGGHRRDAIQADLNQALQLSAALREETPLGRHLRHIVEVSDPSADILIVLRNAEDAQVVRDRLADFLTEPGRFISTVPEVRVTTPVRYPAEIKARPPTLVVWAASPLAGLRAYVGDAGPLTAFRLVITGSDIIFIRKLTDIAIPLPGYSAYADRLRAIRTALPLPPRDIGDLGAAIALDNDRSRRALPFAGTGYLLLDGYGKISAGQSSTFYVVDPVTQRLVPREARSIEVGDGVFVMSDEIREEIEGLLRERDERGRTLEQSMVDHYKAVVKAGIETIERREGRPISAARVREMLFERNPSLPPVSVAAVEYWLRAAERPDVDTPHAALSKEHFGAFIELMGAGAFREDLASAVRIVRAILRREGNVNRAIFDRILLDPDSLIQRSNSNFARLEGLRAAALENVYAVADMNLDPPKRIPVGRELPERVG